MLDVNSWKVVKRMIKQYHDSCKESRVEMFSMSIFFSIIIKSNTEKKNSMLVNKVIVVFIMKIMHK